MLKGRGRDPRAAGTMPPAHLSGGRPPAQVSSIRPAITKAPLVRPEPDYEVVEFPSDQYVNAKLQPPPPPPPRPPTGHPAEAGASCGLCGGGGARVRCAECGRRALCASCDDMYHRHPKRRHHQRQALTSSQVRDERPPLPPKGTPPVPPPRRHKLSSDSGRSSASPRPPSFDQRRATLGHLPATQNHSFRIQGIMKNSSPMPVNETSQFNRQTLSQHQVPQQHQAGGQPRTPAHLQHRAGARSPAPLLGSMPYLSAPAHPPQPAQPAHTALGHPAHPTAHPSAWGHQRGSLQNFNVSPNTLDAAEAWDAPEMAPSSGQTSPWGRPLRRNASVLELGAGAPCAGCAHCAPAAWRYGSCASLEHAWPPAWPACCPPPAPHMHPHAHAHAHMHAPYTPQPYRRGESRAMSRAASRTASRAASPAMSVRSRTSRRTKHRTPSPPPLPSSDADSESDSESDRAPAPAVNSASTESAANIK